jgi:UDP-glucose 4-epimerase
MRPLVTGATTPLGGSIVRMLLADPDVDHLIATGVEREPPAGILPASSRLIYQPVDLTRARAAHDLLFGTAQDLGVDTIIHLATHRSPHGTRMSHRLDVDAARELLLLAERLPAVRHLVFRSGAEVYAVRHSAPDLLDEDQPLELDPRAPASVRDHVEADLTACARMGTGRVAITVLRLAEVLVPSQGSQLWDYLESRVCLRPLGFDPMVNVLSLDDATAAVRLALRARDGGVFNIPGADTLPLSRIAARWGRIDLPVPGPLLAPLYRLRTRVVGLDFRYDLNARRFHFGGMLDGRRARERLGYRPSQPIDWPVAVASPARRSELRVDRLERESTGSHKE